MDKANFHIHLRGQVQGVGFRPYVFRLAQTFGLGGWVCNDVDGVHVEFTANESLAHQFYTELLQNRPALARISAQSMTELAPKHFTTFEIRESGSKAIADTPLTPDFALCDACRVDVRTPGNRRAQYAFTTCTLCGPRYSIQYQLPYDRAHTAMTNFVQCPVCQSEYASVQDRRFFSQTNSCPDCGVQVQYQGEAENWLNRAVSDLKAGKIIALKNTGGYLLLCDAHNSDAVKTLRTRKNRPTKPFALLFSDLDALKQQVFITEHEHKALESPVGPIVLLLMLPQANGLATDEIAPGLSKLGVMLPSTPLLQMLCDAFGKGLVATSGNRSGAPIFFEDAAAFAGLSDIADGFLTHNRAIVTPQDDSVLRFSPQQQQRIVLRRARGLAPAYWGAAWSHSETILACGADLKSTFGWTHRAQVYISQYLGNLEQFDTQGQYQHTLQHFQQLLGGLPETILCDLHPGYFSREIGATLAERWAIPIVGIQHHTAHFAAVLAENDLMNSPEPVLGVIWDGVGYGLDGQIWGGEYFLLKDKTITRAAHLDYFPYLLGDKMSKEPRLAALALCANIPEAMAQIQGLFTAQEWSFYQKMLQKGVAVQTSSMGRLFDAVAALLGFPAVQSFESEAALLLEEAAQQYFSAQGYTRAIAYAAHTPTELIRGICADVQAGKPKPEIAARFHVTLIQWIRQVADDQQVTKIAFSGGVFQNAVLVDLCWMHLPDFDLYFHQELSPNDECIAFGQLAYHTCLFSSVNKTQHVLSNTR